MSVSKGIILIPLRRYYLPLLQTEKSPVDGMVCMCVCGWCRFIILEIDSDSAANFMTFRAVFLQPQRNSWTIIIDVEAITISYLPTCYRIIKHNQQQQQRIILKIGCWGDRERTNQTSQRSIVSLPVSSVHYALWLFQRVPFREHSQQKITSIPDEPDHRTENSIIFPMGDAARWNDFVLPAAASGIFMQRDASFFCISAFLDGLWIWIIGHRRRNCTSVWFGSWLKCRSSVAKRNWNGSNITWKVILNNRGYELNDFSICEEWNCRAIKNGLKIVQKCTTEFTQVMLTSYI